VRQDDDGATVIADTASGPVAVAGRYVIGADGARSAVRRSLGIEFEGFTYPELFLIASTGFAFEQALTDIAYVNYIADPLEWLVLLRVPQLWRVLVPAAQSSDRERLLSDASIQGGAQPRGGAGRTLPDCAPLPLSSASEGGEKLPARPCSARRRRRAHQQSAGRHGHERRHPGCFQPSGQIQGHLGGRR
jgi:hypothetical protein